MSTERYDAEIKTRVPKRAKEKLQELADARHLELADIAREAFRDYVAKHQPVPQEEVKPQAA